MDILKFKLIPGGTITRNDSICVFVLAFLARYLFMIASGQDSLFQQDWSRYDAQSNGILHGSFNLETQLFITAPLFSYVLAGMKYAFGAAYIFVLPVFQIIISCISVLYLLATAQLLFSDYRISMLTGLAFAIYPITLYYTHGLGQESIFESLFIISIYYLSKFFVYRTYSPLIAFAIFFSLALLTKSHVLLIAPFLVLSMFIKNGVNKRAALDVLSVIGIVFLMTLPYGLYNKFANGAYVVSSSGLGGFFVTGHNDDFYTYAVNPPPMGTPEYERLRGMNFEVYDRLTPQLERLSHNEKQKLYLREGIQWSVDNPGRFIILTLHNLYSFIMPGFGFHYHPFKSWIATIILSTPVFALAYFEIVRRISYEYKSNLVIISLFLGMLSFSLIFYAQNRFRVVTIEPFYLMYSCSGLMFIVDYFNRRFREHREGTV